MPLALSNTGRLNSVQLWAFIGAAGWLSGDFEYVGDGVSDIESRRRPYEKIASRDAIVWGNEPLTVESVSVE